MDLTFNEMREMLRDVLAEETGSAACTIAPRWSGGKMVLLPFDTSQKPKEVPIQAFFKKITSVREKLRVLEQKINNHPGLSDEDKAEFQGLITRAYGSLTTFNVLFAEEQDRFVGMKGE